MKKLLWVMVLLLAVAPAFAVTPVKGGIKAGLSMATVTGDDIEGVSSKMGLAAGAFVNIGIGTLAVQPELLYVQKGAQDENNSDYKWKIDYLEIPVLLKATFGTGSAKPNLFIGPALGILMSSKFTDGTNEMDAKDGTSGMDLGLAIGGGVDVSKLTFDIRYELGLSNINKAPEGYTGEMPTTNNSTLMLMVGYSFN